MALSETEKLARRRAHYNKPENKTRIRKYQKVHNDKPETKSNRKVYLNKPEVKARINLHRKVYYNKPKIKARINLQQKSYYNKPKIKAKKRAQQKVYQNKPETKSKRKVYENKTETKSNRRRRANNYNKRPEVMKKRNNRYKKRIKTDSIFAIKKRLRGRLLTALKVYSKNGKVKTSDEYGINYKEIIEFLKPFPRDIHLYHIDHKLPLSSFDFNDPEQIKIAFNKNNYQWLLAKENLSKGTKIEAQSTLL